MKNPKRYTITAALPYTNGPIHIGHLSGVYIPADIYTRYLKLNDKDVLFVCGSDEHGVPITIKAKKEGVTPQDVVDKYNHIIKESFKDFGIQFDNYSRTSAEVHHETATEFFESMHEQDKFIEETTEQLYDPKAKQFLADRFVTGTCPKCGNEEAYGDQCEKCGTSLNANDLINPKSTLTDAKPVLKSTKHWFLPLDQYDAWLKDWIVKGHKDDWKPNVYGQCKSWIDEGLRPRAVTRDLDWGIPVPVEGGDGKVLYVWFDAPIGYISASKEWAKRENKSWEPYWKDEDTKLVHFIGKDNIVFHCIIFPVMLKAEGSYILPDNVPANEFLNLEGQKLSTSKNWAVWLHEYLEEFPNQQDILRYVLTANAPETKDNDFTWKDFQTRNNSELVGIFGNFINRVVVLTDKYYEGIIPEKSELSEVDLEALKELQKSTEDIAVSIEKYRFREAQAKMMNIARIGNKYLADEEPWKLQKTDPKRTKTIMYVALQIAAGLAIISEPFLPFSSAKLKKMLNFEALEKTLLWKDIADKKEFLPKGHQIGKAELLFSKIEDETIEKQLQKLEQTKEDNKEKTYAPVKEEITFDDFSKLDIRVGKIVSAEKMPKAKKLLILKVDIGHETRTIVSGIAEHYKAEEIIGKRVSVVVNLKPIKLRGTLSEGMILMGDNGKNLSFVSPENELDAGSQIS
ncbi:methionine--tRNA ligase [Psychroflexus halocasei]|uniref:Methionine--tRNA ligase n=1 Tax=Psychroflexus halocasei TaxID=908615 RepID=A0A1H4DFN6_9FLAO|nr:methionine--tRNA ligase [Psychroflexus halocasei]SEA71368.1 methionyl-tRNA synthetase [Psychroflexus halocasei]